MQRKQRRDPFRACAKRTSFPQAQARHPFSFPSSAKKTREACRGREAAAIRGSGRRGKRPLSMCKVPLALFTSGRGFQAEKAFPFKKGGREGRRGKEKRGEKARGKVVPPGSRSAGPSPFLREVERLTRQTWDRVGRFIGFPPSRGNHGSCSSPTPRGLLWRAAFWALRGLHFPGSLASEKVLAADNGPPRAPAAESPAWLAKAKARVFFAGDPDAGPASGGDPGSTPN